MSSDCLNEWGRDYSQLSKVFNTVLDAIYLEHKDKVVGNIQWYQDRFDIYNHVSMYIILINDVIMNINILLIFSMLYFCELLENS